MEKSASQVYKEVGAILAEWNPIGVPPELALDEYQAYIAKVYRSRDSEEQLMSCLEDILVNDLGLEYDPDNESHVRDLREVSKKLLAIRS
jgi:hypothetical protein